MRRPLRFHGSLYPPEVLRHAAAEFRDAARISVVSKGRYHHVFIENIRSACDEKTVRGNFANYVLMLAKAAL